MQSSMVIVMLCRSCAQLMTAGYMNVPASAAQLNLLHKPTVH